MVPPTWVAPYEGPLIGKGKQLLGQHNRGGFTKMVLAMGTCMGETTDTAIMQSLASIRELAVRAWTKKTIGTTLASIRRTSLPGTKGASRKNG